jgi:hypothetical protein
MSDAMLLRSITLSESVLTAVVKNSTAFRDITPCSPLKVNRRFGGKCRLRLKVRRKPSKKPTGSSSVLLLGLLSDREDGKDMLLRNVGSLATEYMRHISSHADLKEVCTCRGQEKRNSDFVLKHHRCITAVHELDISGWEPEGSIQPSDSCSLG